MVEEKARSVPANSALLKSRRKTPCCWCLLCSLGTLLVVAIVIVILIFTLFTVRDPTMTLNKIIFAAAKPGGSIIQPGSNITMIADASFKNPNVGTFRFNSTTSSIFYKGILVGQAYGPPGHARAHRTVRMNTTVELVAAKILTAPNLSDDLLLGLFNMESYTRVPGKVKVLFVVKKIVVEMNCTVAFNITSQEIQDQNCKSHVDF